MNTLALEVFSQATNAAIVRMPGRRFPGVVIQGDTLSTLVASLRELCAKIEAGDADALEDASHLRDRLQELQAHYERCWPRTESSCRT